MTSRLIWVCLTLFFAIDFLLYCQYSRKVNKAESSAVYRSPVLKQVDAVMMREEPATNDNHRSLLPRSENKPVPMADKPACVLPPPKAEKKTSWEDDWEKERQ